MRRIIFLLSLLAVLFEPAVVLAAGDSADYKLSPGDTIKIQVFQNPDLALETKVPDSGVITYPLIGEVRVGGSSVVQAEQEIARRLEQGGFVKRPQVTVVPVQSFGNQVSVLGQVNHSGRFPLESNSIRLTEVLALAGGVTQAGADTVFVSGTRDGKPFNREIDIPSIFIENDKAKDIVLQGGDVIYVHRYPFFYVYGEAQRPGSYRVERGMTIQQAIAAGGGPTPRGTDKRIRLTRRTANGVIQTDNPPLSDPVLPDDVIYVRESIF